MSATEVRERALENLAGHRRLRESAEERWARSIAVALAAGNAVEDVADAAGLTVDEVKTLAESA